MSARRPGEAEIVIDGERRRLRLTLGALAEIEETVGGGDFEALRARLATPNAADILAILHALLAGGGEAISVEALRRADIDLAAAARAIADAFGGLGEEPGQAPGKPEGKARAFPGRTGSGSE